MTTQTITTRMTTPMPKTATNKPITLSFSLSPFLYTNNLHTKKQLRLQPMAVPYLPRVLLDLSLLNHMMENDSYVAMDNQLGLILDPSDPKFAPFLRQCG